MKTIVLLAALALSLAAGTVARAATTTDTVSASLQVPARGSEQVIAYGADTVCKLGCWG